MAAGGSKAGPAGPAGPAASTGSAMASAMGSVLGNALGSSSPPTAAGESGTTVNAAEAKPVQPQAAPLGAAQQPRIPNRGLLPQDYGRTRIGAGASVVNESPQQLSYERAQQQALKELRAPRA